MFVRYVQKVYETRYTYIHIYIYIYMCAYSQMYTNRGLPGIIELLRNMGDGLLQIPVLRH